MEVKTRRFRYVVETFDALGQRIVSQGVVTDNTLQEALNTALMDSFQNATSGAAIYGQPGQGGCRGPYTVKRVELTEEGQ